MTLLETIYQGTLTMYQYTSDIFIWMWNEMTLTQFFIIIAGLRAVNRAVENVKADAKKFRENIPRYKRNFDEFKEEFKEEFADMKNDFTAK